MSTESTNPIRGALAELVALEDIKRGMARLAAQPDYLERPEDVAAYDELSRHYSERRPAAWNAARVSLSAPETSDSSTVTLQPENIRVGDPYDDPAFEQMAREHDVWGKADSALCAVFWLAGKAQPPIKTAPAEVASLTGQFVSEQAGRRDDEAVDRFAAAMKAKLAKKRAEGRGGWYDKAQCSQDHLSLLLRSHITKGDPVDVANFCMMLHQRGERISGRDEALRPAPPVVDAVPEDAQRDTARFIADVEQELSRARRLFPGDRIMGLALAEEFGELIKALLDEPGKNVWKEAVQTAVMAARVAVDGDNSVDAWRASKGLDNHRRAGSPQGGAE